MSEIFRGEHFELSFGLEANYGVDPGTSVLTTPFGVFDRGQMADPEIEFTPFYGGGGVQARRYFRAYRGRWALEASVADVLLLDGKVLALPLGSVVTTGPVGSVYTHTISEETLLKSLTMHASFWRADDAAGSPRLMRRYIGGKVGRATLTAEENERLRLSFDSVLFKNLSHNISGVDKYAAGVARPTVSYPTTEPYFFSGGILKVTGAQMTETTFARVRSFRLDINNNVEAKYYVAGHDPAIPIPYTVLEGKREYTLAVTVDPTDHDLYSEVLRSGRSGAGLEIGIKAVMTISRGTDDYIEISAPSGTPSLTNQGGFIRRGRLDIDSGSPAISQELEILTRSVSVVAKDLSPWTGW